MHDFIFPSEKLQQSQGTKLMKYTGIVSFWGTKRNE